MPRPTHHRPCLFCGANVQIRTDDPFLTATQSNTGRSYNFCKYHWRKLRQVATSNVIDTYRRTRLTARTHQTLTVVLQDLAYEMRHVKQ